MEAFDFDYSRKLHIIEFDSCYNCDLPILEFANGSTVCPCCGVDIAADEITQSINY